MKRIGGRCYIWRRSLPLAGEISSVVGDDCVRNSEATHYVLSEEFDNLLPTNFNEWYHLGPFGKIVNGYQQEM